MLTLYTTAISANGRKPLALARHLGLHIDVRAVDVYRGEGRAPEYLKLNPAGKIPTLVDGGFVLTESNAILAYLAERDGGAELAAGDAQQRANALRWMFWESSHWQPVLSRVLAPRVREVLFSARDADSSHVPWDDAELVAVLQLLESQLTQHAFVCGARLSIADFSLAGMTTYFRVSAFPRAQYPALSAWLDRLQGLPAWASTCIEPW